VLRNVGILHHYMVPNPDRDLVISTHWSAWNIRSTEYSFCLSIRYYLCAKKLVVAFHFVSHIRLSSIQRYNHQKQQPTSVLIKMVNTDIRRQALSVYSGCAKWFANCMWVRSLFCYVMTSAFSLAITTRVLKAQFCSCRFDLQNAFLCITCREVFGCL
jgi:hypothetical protein